MLSLSSTAYQVRPWTHMETISTPGRVLASVARIPHDYLCTDALGSEPRNVPHRRVTAGRTIPSTWASHLAGAPDQPEPALELTQGEEDRRLCRGSHFRKQSGQILIETLQMPVCVLTKQFVLFFFLIILSSEPCGVGGCIVRKYHMKYWTENGGNKGIR